MLVATSNLSAYELERLSNVERNNEHLRSLGLSSAERKTYTEIFGTASRYHLLHALLLLCAPLARFPMATTGLLLGGKLLFVGSL